MTVDQFPTSSCLDNATFVKIFVIIDVKTIGAYSFDVGPTTARGSDFNLRSGHPMQLSNAQSVVHLFTILVPDQLTRWTISVVFRMLIHLEKRVKQVGLDLQQYPVLYEAYNIFC